MPLPDALRKVNRAFTNPVLGVLVGIVPPFARLIHVGRRSGRSYRTTLWAFGQGGEVAVALTYGSHVDWVKNVLAASGGKMQMFDGTWSLANPRLIRGDEGACLVPSLWRAAMALIRVDEYLVANRTRAAQTP